MDAADSSERSRPGRQRSGRLEVTTTIQDTHTTAWAGLHGGAWRDEVKVRDFIQANYTPYAGDGSFLAGATERTTALWARLGELFPVERERGKIGRAHV